MAIDLSSLLISKTKSIQFFQNWFLKQGTRRSLLDVDQCPIATGSINKELPVARRMLANKKNTLKKRHPSFTGHKWHDFNGLK